jgi:hypothetical protein
MDKRPGSDQTMAVQPPLVKFRTDVMVSVQGI